MAGSLTNRAKLLRANGRDMAALRRERGLSRDALAELSAVHPNTIGVMERGERDVSILTQTRVLASLGCEAVLIEDGRYRFVPGSPFDPRPGEDILSTPPPAIVSYIGSAFRARRREYGLSLEELANRAGVHRNTLWNLERGLVVPSAWVVFLFHYTLGVHRVRASSSGLFLD